MLLQLNRLVTQKWVDGWDDPRLMTLAGLQRRGVTSTAINAFVRGIGITRRLKTMLRLLQRLPGLMSISVGLMFHIFVIPCATVTVV